MTHYEYFKSLKSEKFALADLLSQNLDRVLFKNGSIILNRKTAKWDWWSRHTPGKAGIDGKGITLRWLGLTAPNWLIHDQAVFLLNTKIMVAFAAEPGRKEWMFGVTAPNDFKDYIAEGVITADEFREVIKYWFHESPYEDMNIPRDKKKLMRGFGFFKKEDII